MQSSELKTKLLMLSGIGRPTEKVKDGEQEIEREKWSEEDTANTIAELLKENDRLESDLKATKERYINDFLSTPNPNSPSPEPLNTEIKIEDYMNI